MRPGTQIKKPILVGILDKPPDSLDDMVVHLDELIAATGHLMSLVYLPRIVHEKRM